VLAANAVWVACDAGNALVRIDPETAEVTDTVDVGFGPVELELGFDSLWVRNRQLELVRVDPQTAGVLAEIPGFDTSPSLGLSFGGGFVWASRPNGMGAIDPASNEVVQEIPLPGTTFMDSYWLDDTLWVTTGFEPLLLEVDAASP
jgi:streptogramin lyase